MLPVCTTRVCISVALVEQRNGGEGGGKGEEEVGGGIPGCSSAPF